MAFQLVWRAYMVVLLGPVIVVGQDIPADYERVEGLRERFSS